MILIKYFMTYCCALLVIQAQTIRAQSYTKTDLIKLYAQEWGFLTYYTTAPSENEKKWFNFLVYSLKELDKSGNLQRFKDLSDSLLSYVKIPDEVLNQRKLIYQNDTLLNPNLYSWMNNSFFEENDRLKFKKIQQSPVLYPSSFRPQRYIPSVFTDTSISMPLIRRVPPVNQSYEALAGFIVFWNATNYYSAYPIGRKSRWDDILDEFIPKFLGLKDVFGKEFHNQYRDLMQQATSKLEDSHTVKFKFIEGYQGYIQIDYIDSICYITKIHPKLSEIYKIYKGDAIIKKDGILMTDIYVDLEKYFRGSHSLVTDRNMLPYLLTFTNPITHLRILKPDKSICEVDIKLADIQSLKINDNLNEYKNWQPYDGTYSIHSDTIFNDSIVYINIGKQTEKALKKKLKQNSDKRYFIFDFRNYPYNLYFIFTASGKIKYYFNNSSIPDKSYNEFNTSMIPGYFHEEEKFIPRPLDRPSLLRWEKFNKRKNKKVYLLCNEYSQSKTESILVYFSSVTKGTIIGRNTAGVPVSAGAMYLPGKIFFMFTIGEGYDYKKRIISGKGVEPDFYVKKNIYNIIRDKDDILDKAIELIYKK